MVAGGIRMPPRPANRHTGHTGWHGTVKKAYHGFPKFLRSEGSPLRRFRGSSAFFILFFRLSRDGGSILIALVDVFPHACRNIFFIELLDLILEFLLQTCALFPYVTLEGT